MNHIITAAAIAATAGIASAQFQFQLDDGSAEDSIGLTSGGLLGWINLFETTADNQIVSVEVAFGAPGAPGGSGVVPGDLFNVFVFEDNDNDPTNGYTLLDSATANAQAGAIETDGFQSVAVNATITQPFFWIGASIEHAAGEFPAAVDQTQNSLGRSWATIGSPDDPGAQAGAVELDSIGLNGVWLLRATGVPTPGAAGILTLAGLAAARRRR